MKFQDITLDGIDAKGKEVKHKLADLKGKNIILYFYPKDETPVCTKEATHFKKAIKKLPKDTVVIGVSPDDIESHKKFFKKHELNFEILSDVEMKLAKSLKNVKESTKDKMIDMKTKSKEKVEDIKEDIEKIKDDIEDATIHKKDKMPIMMRSTFIIGKDGKLLKEMKDIKLDGHIEEVVEFVNTLK